MLGVRRGEKKRGYFLLEGESKEKNIFKVEEIKIYFALIFAGNFPFRIACQTICPFPHRLTGQCLQTTLEIKLLLLVYFPYLIQHKSCYMLPDLTCCSLQMSHTGGRKMQQYLGKIMALFSRGDCFLLIRCYDMKN